MKKLLLMLLLVSGSCFAQNVKIASPSTPSQNIISGITVNSSTNMVVPGSLTVSNNFVLPKSATPNFVWTCTNANGNGTWLVSSSTNAFLNAITNVTSVGSGESLRSAVSNNIFFIKSLVAGSNITIVDSGGTNLTIASSASGGGTNTVRTAYLSTHTGAAAYTWNTVTNITTVATTGKVSVRGQVMSIATAAALVGIRIRDATTNISQYVSIGQAGGVTSPLSGQTVIEEYLTGVAKTYTLEVFSSGAGLVYTNAAAAGAQNPEITSTLGITLVESP